MVCTSCGQTSLLGKVVQGRSTAGYDYRAVNQYGLGQGRGDVVYNGYVKPSPEYGTTNLPTNSIGYPVRSAPTQPKLGFDWGSFVVGGLLGLTFGFLVFTATGREIGYRAGRRIARRI